MCSKRISLALSGGLSCHQMALSRPPILRVENELDRDYIHIKDPAMVHRLAHISRPLR